MSITPLTRSQSSFVGAVAIADMVKSTLGPKGMVRMPLPAAAVRPATDCMCEDRIQNAVQLFRRVSSCGPRDTPSARATPCRAIICCVWHRLRRCSRARVLACSTPRGLLCAQLRTCRAAQDKILQSMGRGQHAMVTNDGATILKSVYVDNPAAKVLVGASWP